MICITDLDVMDVRSDVMTVELQDHPTCSQAANEQMSKCASVFE